MKENYVIWDNREKGYVEKIFSATEEEIKFIKRFLELCERNGICDIGIEKAENYIAEDL